MEYESQYKYIIDYPEFSYEQIIKKYQYWVVTDSATGDGNFELPKWIFAVDSAYNYVISVYDPDSPLMNIKDLRVRKEKALGMYVDKDQWDYILGNKNPMIGDMITRLFREVNDFDYELMISAKEAIETLMEVVRKPIDTNLQDDKERNAVKAKRECFDDARYLLGEIRKMQLSMEEKSPDVAEHVNKSVFRAGLAEKLSEKYRK